MVKYQYIQGAFHSDLKPRARHTQSYRYMLCNCLLF